MDRSSKTTPHAATAPITENKVEGQGKSDIAQLQQVSGVEAQSHPAFAGASVLDTTRLAPIDLQLPPPLTVTVEKFKDQLTMQRYGHMFETIKSDATAARRPDAIPRPYYGLDDLSESTPSALGFGAIVQPPSFYDIFEKAPERKHFEAAGKQVKILNQDDFHARTPEELTLQLALVLAADKGDRPEDVRAYMKPEAVASHLQKFKGKVSVLMPQSNFIRYVIPSTPSEPMKLGRGPSKFSSPHGEQFVGSAAEVDEVLASAKSTHGGTEYVHDHYDFTKIEDEMGITEKWWQNQGGGLVRIDIPVDQDFHLRMANGREAGANGLWLPGGKLPDGKVEAVIDRITLDHSMVTYVVQEPLFPSL